MKRVSLWLNLYCEQRGNNGTFTVQGNPVVANSVKEDLSYMEDQGWISRNATNLKGNVAKYRVIEKDLDDDQIEEFYSTMGSQAEEKEEAWKRVKKLFKLDTNEEIWKFLEKNL